MRSLIYYKLYLILLFITATVEYNIHIPLTNRSVLGESPAMCGLEITEFALQKTTNIGENTMHYF